jgi:hypothetical protein
VLTHSEACRENIDRLLGLYPAGWEEKSRALRDIILSSGAAQP